MSMPPDDIDASDLFQQIARMPRASMELDIPVIVPGSDMKPIGRYVMQVLTQAEQEAALASAEAWVRKQLKESPKKGEENISYTEMHNNACSVELVLRAARRASNPALPFFPSVEELRDKLTPDTLGRFVDDYMNVQRKLGPTYASLTKDEMDAWLKRLGEGGNSYPLRFLSLVALEELVMHSASQLYNSPTDTSSSGGPQDSPTPE